MPLPRPLPRRSAESAHYDVLEEQPALGFSHEKKQLPQIIQSLATSSLADILSAVQCSQEDVHVTGLLKSNSRRLGERAQDRGSSRHLEVSKGHLVFCAVIALGMLVILAPLIEVSAVLCLVLCSVPNRTAAF